MICRACSGHPTGLHTKIGRARAGRRQWASERNAGGDLTTSTRSSQHAGRAMLRRMNFHIGHGHGPEDGALHAGFAQRFGDPHRLATPGGGNLVCGRRVRCAVFSAGGGLIQAPAGMGDSRGLLFLNRLGWARNAASSVAWRMTRISGAKPRCTLWGGMQPMPQRRHCTRLMPYSSGTA